MVKKFFFGAVFAFIFGVVATAQEILTAAEFFKSVSEFYGIIRDYEANCEINVGRTKMRAKVSFKRPNLLRIDFSNPQGQVIVFNGDALTIFLPGSQAVLNQSVSQANQSGANLATPQGLSLMARYYTVAYEIGQTPVLLEDGSEEYVVKLVLSRRNTSEAFRFLKVAINPDTNLFRRIEAVTPQGETFQFDFFDYVLNSGFSEQRFLYDAPSSANNYNNFLFSD